MMGIVGIYLLILWLTHSNHLAIGSYASPQMQVLQIPQCINGALSLNNFTISTGNTNPKYDTNVYICYRPISVFDHKPYSLLIEYKMNDQAPSSPFNQCNQPLYEYDAVEFFITPYVYNQQTPTSYVEIELNPNGALFASTIDNTCDNCSCIKGTPIECDDKGIIDYNATITTNHDGKQSWTAYIEITVDFIAKYSDLSQDKPYNLIGADNNMYRINFYRIDDLIEREKNVTQYSCWNATLLNPPCFHVPSSFGYFQFM